MHIAWLRTSTTKPKKRARHNRRGDRSILSLEYLEDRTLLSATLTIDASNNLTYVGSGDVANQLTITRTGANYTFSDSAETITVVDSSLTVQFSGSGSNSVAQTAGTVSSLAINGGSEVGSAVIIGTGGASTAGGISVTGWDTIQIQSAVTTTGPGQILLSAVGGVTNTLTVGSGSSLTTSGGGVNVFASNGTLLGANVSTSGGSVVFNHAILLTNDVVVDAGAAGNATFWGTINGAKSLSVVSGGSTTFGNTVGITTPLAILTTDSAGTTVVPGNMVTTSGLQSYQDAVTFGTNPQLTASTASFGKTVSGGGTFTITGSASFSGAVSGFNQIAISENATFGGAPAGLQTLSVGGTAVVNVAALTTAGSQTYAEGITLQKDATLTGTTVTLGGPINGGSKSLTISGNVVINGSADGLTSFSVSGTTALNSGVISTAASQSFTGVLTLGTNSTLTGTSINLGSVAGGSRSLAIFGNATLNGPASGLSSLTVSGTTLMNSSSITTTGTQTYSNEISLGSNVTFTGSTVEFSGTVTGGGKDLAVAGSAVFYGAVAGVQALSVTGTATIHAPSMHALSHSYSGPVVLGAHTTLSGASANFTGSINGAGFDLTLTFSGACVISVTSFTGVRHLTSSAGGSIQLGGTLTTSGNQTYADPVSLSGPVTLAGNTVTIGAAVNGGGNNLTINSAAALNATLSQINNLSISGAASLNVASVTTTGTQSYPGGLTLSANTNLTASSVTLGPVTGTGHSLSVSGNNLVNGPLTGLSSLSFVGTTLLNTANVTTSGAQSYAGIVTILTNAVLAGTNVSFGSTVASGGSDLTLVFSGITTINGASFIGIRNLSVAAGGSTQLTGALVTTGNQSFHSPVTLTNDVNLTGSSVTLANVINANNHSLTVTGSATFGGILSNLTSLTINGPTILQIPHVTTSAAQSYIGILTLTADTFLNGSTITLGGSVVGNTFGLDVVGNVSIAGVSGIRSLSITGAVLITGATVATTESQTYSGLVTLAVDTVLSGETVGFGSEVLGNGNNLTLAFTGTTSLDGADFSGINDFATGQDGATLLSGSFTTSGIQTFNNQVIVTASTNLTGTSISFGTLMAVGNSSLLINGNAALNGIVTGVANLTITGDAVLSTAAVTTSGVQVYQGTVTLSSDVVLTGSVVNLGTSLSAAGKNLQVVGDAILGASVNGVANLTVSGAVELGGAISTSGVQTYHGNAALRANSTLSAGTANISLLGSVDGPFHLTIAAANDVILSGPIGATAPLSGLTFDASGDVNVTGAITLGAGALTIGGANTAVIFSGVISGPGNLVLTGPGTVTLSADNTFTGITEIQGGMVIINGAQPSSAVTLNGGTLSGTGMVGVVSANQGTAAPGIAGAGVLQSGGVTLSAAANYAVNVAGADIPGQPNHIATAGAVSLGDSTLLVSVSFMPPLAEELLIVRNDGNDPIVGTFAGLPEGGLVKVTQTWLQISYQGGDGNDVALRRYVEAYFVIAGTGHVEVRQRDGGALLYTFMPYGPAYTKGVSVAIGDVDGDGYSDIVTGALVGNPHVKVYDGAALSLGTFDTDNPDTNLLEDWFPYALQFNVGATVAVGDINDDGYADIVTGASGGNPDVRAYNGKHIALGTFEPAGKSLLAQWFPYALQFNVGANVAVGDVNQDGFADVLTGATAGNPDIRLYSGLDIANKTFKPNGKSLLTQFFAYGLNFNVGAYVAIGDTNDDGYGDVITGSSVGNPEVHVYDGKAIANKTFKPAKPGESLLTQFFAFELGNNIGVSVASANFEGTGEFAILTGAGKGAPKFRVFRGDASGVAPLPIFEGISDSIDEGLCVGA